MPFATFRDGIPPGQSPEGTNTLVSGSGDNTVIIWDVKTGEQKAQLKSRTNWVSSVAWGPEGTHRNGR